MLTFRLVTSILDPADATADELARTYHERWEIESAFREIEIYLRQGKGIRSKTPELVRQELYGLFLTHYAIRAFMTEAADTVDMDPDRLSFTRTINIIRRRITDPAAFSPGTRKILHQRDITETLERTNKRRNRTYPRVQKPGNRHLFTPKKANHRQKTYRPHVLITRPKSETTPI